MLRHTRITSRYPSRETFLRNTRSIFVLWTPLDKSCLAPPVPFSSPGSLNLNQVNVYHNKELYDALVKTRAGLNDPLFDQMLIGLNLNPDRYRIWCGRNQRHQRGFNKWRSGNQRFDSAERFGANSQGIRGHPCERRLRHSHAEPLQFPGCKFPPARFAIRSDEHGRPDAS